MSPSSSGRVVDSALTTAVSLSGALPDRMIGLAARTTVRIASLGLRPRLRANLHAAFGPERVFGQMERDFFDCAADWARYTALTFQRGFDRSGFAEEGGELDDTVGHLARAAALGRGVVLVGPHQFGHELFATLLHRRITPMVGIIRPERHAALFGRWYAQLGLPTILRPPHSGAVSDFRVLLRVLKDGSTLGVTPDLPGGPEAGDGVRWFGRHVRLRAGAFWLALRGRAPLVCYWIERRGPRFIIRFSHAVMIEREPGVPTARTIQRHLQAWTAAFEQELRTHPGGWAFWVDRRWTRVLRQPQVASQ